MNIDWVHQKLSHAGESGLILPSACDCCKTWLNAELFEPWMIESISELVEGSHWSEINDRFYKRLAFGTGGLRGRTIGHFVTLAEWGNRQGQQCPQHPAVGSNCMNDFNVRLVTMGLMDYLKTQSSPVLKPRVVFAHDTRHFSRYLAELAANTVLEMGGEPMLFESERSTPELSFTIQFINADAGVVITASHNPPHDNGFKAYFSDGGQIVEPHASGIIAKVQALSLETVCQRKNQSSKPVTILGPEIDQHYMERLYSLILNPEIVQKYGAQLQIVYSPLHGTGSQVIPQVLRKMGCRIFTVPEQMIPDGQFPTVKSPNPENAEALTLSIRLAEQKKADIVMATDPDADRMGAAVLNREGKMVLLNGNQMGSLLAHDRLERLFAKGILNEENGRHARLIKTVVTTDFQKAIAQKFNVGITETLTGFKYIGQKLAKYEDILRKKTGLSQTEYRSLTESSKRDLLLKHSYYCVFAGEESYGYSASDFTHEKDASSACIMFAELAISAKSRGQTVLDYLDALYAELGYHQEKLGQLVYEGAKGADQIQAILRSYETKPPSEMAGVEVVKIANYAKEDIRDSEGDLLPKELLFFVELKNGARYAVRGSGTEPKIKFYLFASEKPPPGSKFSEKSLHIAKNKTAQSLESLWKAIESDSHKRTAL